MIPIRIFRVCGHEFLLILISSEAEPSVHSDDIPYPFQTLEPPLVLKCTGFGKVLLDPNMEERLQILALVVFCVYFQESAGFLTLNLKVDVLG